MTESADNLASGKPILLLIHRSWCGACKGATTIYTTRTSRTAALKPKIAASEEIAKLSDQFVMVNTEVLLLCA